MELRQKYVLSDARAIHHAAKVGIKSCRGTRECVSFRPLQLNLMFLGPDRPIKYKNVKILFNFQVYVLVM